MAIPPFTSDGLLPPIRPGVGATHKDRSPYRATMVEVARVFATTEDRRVIFRGFLRLRAALRGLGFASGVQWLDGSFVEDCERTRAKPPGDIDVVSWLPFEGDSDHKTTLLASNPDEFFWKRSKEKYRVDHYPFELGQALAPARLKLVSYWYSMWSHRRDDQRWKGFVQVDLSDDDGPAAAFVGDGEEASHAP